MRCPAGCGGGSSTHIDMSTFFDVTSFQSTSQNTAWQRRRAHMHKHSLFLMYHILTTSGGDPCIKSYSFFPSKFVQLVWKKSVVCNQSWLSHYTCVLSTRAFLLFKIHQSVLLFSRHFYCLDGISCIYFISWIEIGNLCFYHCKACINCPCEISMC